MSQYYGNTRTNYFRVTDPDKFKDFIGQVKDEENDSVTLWEKEDETGTKLFAFGCFSSIVGILSTESRVREIIYDACAEAYSCGHLTEDLLSDILEEIELNELKYGTDDVTEYFSELVNNNDFAENFYAYEGDVEHTFDGFVESLQMFLPDGEVVVITETGHEKLVYVGGSVTVITNNDCKFVTLEEVAAHLAKQMTQNDDVKISYY